MIKNFAIECERCGNQLPIQAVEIEKNSLTLTVGFCKFCREEVEQEFYNAGLCHDKAFEPMK